MLMARKIRAFGGCLAFAFLAQLSASSAQAKAADSPPLKFEVYQDASQEYRWRLTTTDDKNPKVLATGGQGYKAKADCMHGVKIIQDGSDKLNYETYQDKSGDYRWRAKSSNGQVVASSPSGYKTKADCDSAVDTIKKGAPKATSAEVKDAKS
jgi:uncharacterized protein YegP (UPF0339 family)